MAVFMNCEAENGYGLNGTGVWVQAYHVAEFLFLIHFLKKRIP
jgi:hypothetical protein